MYVKNLLFLFLCKILLLFILTSKLHHHLRTIVIFFFFFLLVSFLICFELSFFMFILLRFHNWRDVFYIDPIAIPLIVLMDNSQLTNVFVMLSFVFIIKLFQKMIIEKINNYFFQIGFSIKSLKLMCWLLHLSINTTQQMLLITC